MDDELINVGEALDGAVKALNEAIADNPEGARQALKLPPGAPLQFTPDDVRRMAQLGQAIVAMSVRCVRGCGHTDRPQVAFLMCGITTCDECLRTVFADVEVRDDARCDLCDALSGELWSVRYRLTDGPRVVANACSDCCELWESV